jgi:hypothetical protein
MSATDKNGKELEVGDEIIVRGKVMAIPMKLEEGGLSILHIKWESESMPMLDYIKSNQVEKVKKAE